MKIQQVTLKSLAQNECASLHSLKSMNPEIVLVFGHYSYFEEKEKLLACLNEYFPKAFHIGCSSAGEIAGQRIEDHTLVVTALSFETNVSIKAVSASIETMEDSFRAGQSLVKTLPTQPHAMIVFAPGTQVNGSALIQGMKTLLSHYVSISGGLAGDQGRFQVTYTLLNQSILSNQAVALALSGDGLNVQYGCFGGWQPFGPVRKVTRCDGNILYEFDHQPAIQTYKHYLGDHAKGLPATSLLFPFAVLNENHEETGMIRTILGIDDSKGALILAGDIKEGSYVKLMHASTDRLVEGASIAAERVMEKTPV
jgi:hypothetical protein